MSATTIARVRQERDILVRELGGTIPVQLGRISGSYNNQSADYIGVMMSGVPVDSKRFGGVKSVNMLVLLPPDYPRLPPIGVYLDKPYEMGDTSHFIHSAHHGAPELKKMGWYWYCHAMGGFHERKTHQSWRPTAHPESGHNLATVVVAARVALHVNEGGRR